MNCALALPQSDDFYEKAQKSFSKHLYEEAEIHLKNVLKESPEHLPSRILMAEVLLAQGDATGAEVQINIAREMGADKDRLLLLLTSTYLQQSKYNKVLDLLANTQRGQLNSYHHYVFKGQAHLGLRQLELSEENFRIALTLSKLNQDANLGIAQIYINRFEFNKAQNYVSKVINGYAPPIKSWLLYSTIKQNLGSNQEALEAVNNALLINREHHQALITRATIFVEMSQFTLAEEDINHLLKIVPNEPRALFIKAIIIAHNESENSKKEVFDEITEILNHLPEDVLKANPSYFYLASIIFYQNKSYQIAKQHISSFLLIDRFNIKAMHLSATIDIAQGKLTLAKSILNKANLLKAGNAQTLTLLGIVYFELQQFEKAKYYFSLVKEIAPSAVNSDTQLVQSYLALGENELAISTLQNSTTGAKNQLLVSFLLVEAHINSGQLSKAIAIAQNMVKSSPKNVDIIHHLGFVFKLAKQPAAAQQQFERALLIDPKHVKSVISLSRLELQKGKVKDAVVRLEATQKVLPENIAIMHALANIYIKTRNYQLAHQLYRNAYKLAPKDINALTQYIFSNVKLNQTTQAIEELNSFLLQHEKSAQLYILLGKLYAFADMPTKAIQAYHDALKLDVNRSKVHLYIAQVYQSMKESDQAIAQYHKSIAWEESNVKAVIGLANLYLLKNQPQLTIKTINSFTEDELPTELLMLFAQAHFSLKNYNTSITTYKKIIKKSSSDRAIVGLTQVYMQSKNEKNAIKLLQNSLKNTPNNLLLNTHLAEIYINKSQWKNAQTIYQHLLTLFTKHPAVLNNAAHIELNMHNYEQAKTLVQRSLALIGNQPDSLDTLGWIYYQMAQYQKALPLFREALAIDYSRINIKYHLALTLKALNRDKEAIEMLNEVVSDTEPFTHRRTAERALKEWMG